MRFTRTRRTARLALRLNQLVAFGFNRLLWSKLFTRRRGRAPKLSVALLARKNIRSAPPELTVVEPSGRAGPWPAGFAAVHAGLFLNLQPAGALAPSRYAHPAPAFRAIYLWDSAFIAQIWKWWDPEVAHDVLRAVVDRRDGDRLQHFVADFASSRFTQPPLIAWSLAQLADTVAPARFDAWARDLYGPLLAYHRWLFAHRRLANGLFAWAHAYESGVENAPRFSSRDERRLDDTRDLAAPDFSTYMVLNCEALAVLARRLGRAAEAEARGQEAAALRAAVNRHLWNDDEGLYFDCDRRTGRHVRSRTIASLLPLWAGIPDAVQAARLHRHILAPEAFNTIIPLPSVALSDATFEKDMWRGPVWVNLAFAVIAGLRRYDFHETAADLAFRLCDGVYRTFQRTGHFHEFYDPERHDVAQLHRKRGNRWKRLTLGARPVTEFIGWSGLVNTLIVDVLFGLRRVADDLVIQPRFPPRAESHAFSLRLPREAIGVMLDVGAHGRVVGRVCDRTGERPIAADFGQVVALGQAVGAGHSGGGCEVL